MRTFQGKIPFQVPCSYHLDRTISLSREGVVRVFWIRNCSLIPMNPIWAEGKKLISLFFPLVEKSGICCCFFCLPCRRRTYCLLQSQLIYIISIFFVSIIILYKLILCCHSAFSLRTRLLLTVFQLQLKFAGVFSPVLDSVLWQRILSWTWL